MTLGRTRAEALSIAMNRLSNTNVTRYGFAVAGVVLGILLRLSLDRALGDHFPFATLFLAVLVVAGYAGRGPAFLTVGLGAVASARFLLPPRDSLEVRGFENQAGLVLYLVVGVGIALLGGALRNARIWAERNADQAVRQREQLRITLSSIGDAVLITDAEGRVTSLNPVAEALTGWPSSEAVGKPLPSIFHIINEETRREVENPALRTLNEGVIVGLANHTLLIDRNGTERPIDDSAGPIVDSAGRVVGAVLIFRDIGEKRKAEAELRRAGERARTILESITDGFCALDHDWRFTYVNRQAEVLLGRTSEDLLGKNHWDEYPAMIGTVFERDYRRAVAENLAVSFEEYYPPHDRWYEIHAYPSADGLSIYFQDISERVRANEALKAGEDRLRLALAAGRMGTWDWDISTGSLTWSDNLEEVHGLPPGGFDGTVDGFRRLVHPGDRDRVEAAIAHSIKEGTGYEAEFRFDRPDGTVGWMLGTGKVFADEAGRPARMIGLALDISERKRGEADLRVAQERLAAIIDHSPAIIFLKDREGRYLLINRRFEEFAIDLGIEGPYLGRCDADLLPREIAERFRSDDLEVMETRRVKIFEESVELGEVGRTGLTTKFPLLDERGEVYAVCGINLDISERKRAEERTHFQAHLLDTVGQAVIVNDPEGQITYWNRFAETLYGWRENEVTGCNIMDTVVPPEARATAAGIIGHLRTGANWSGEFTFRRKDSTTFPAFMTDTPIFDEHGTLKAIICISMDITERKRAEEELRERERFTQRILDASPGVVYVFDLEDRRTVFINERARGTIGLTPEAIEAKGGSFLAERVHPDDLPGVEAHLARISTLVDGDVLATEYRMRHADGRWLWFVSRDTVFQRSQDGKPRQVLGVASDITDQREAEKKLRESEERFRTMAESIPQLAWMARPDGHIYWYNKRWHEYTGTTPEQMEGWGWQSVHDPNMLPSVLERWESSIASGEPFDMVFPLKGADGNFRPFLTRVMPVWSEDGQVAHWFGTNTDIADRQR